MFLNDKVKVRCPGKGQVQRNIFATPQKEVINTVA